MHKTVCSNCDENLETLKSKTWISSFGMAGFRNFRHKGDRKKIKLNPFFLQQSSLHWNTNMNWSPLTHSDESITLPRKPVMKSQLTWNRRIFFHITDRFQI